MDMDSEFFRFLDEAARDAGLSGPMDSRHRFIEAVIKAALRFPDTAWIVSSYSPPAAVNPQESINAEADRIITGARKQEYGPAVINFQRVANGWSTILGTDEEGLPVLNVTPHQVILMMIWLKTCRALQGYQRDSYVDICGYAGLAEQVEASNL